MWTQTLPEEIQPNFDLKKEPFGFVIQRVEQHLFGYFGAARLAVASANSEDEETALYRCSFLVRILEQMNSLRNPDGRLTDTATKNMARIATETGVEWSDLVPLLTLIIPSTVTTIDDS